jgi:hypothetical protein
MSRPSIVVGLGGTGQWVLTWLKRDLLLSNNGRMPKNVRLLEIDTSTKLEAGASRVTGSGVQEEAVEVGGVTLEGGEFIYVGGESRRLAEQVRDKRHPQIESWYRADTWLSDLTATAFTLDDGAGRLRQFGRLAVFKDLLGQETDSNLWNALRTAFNEVRSATTEQMKLEVILIGSFAGGTGSGLFIDIALLLRHLAKIQIGTDRYILRGFFALPSVFSNSPDEEMKVRSFAAWRELNRFMVVNPFFPMPEIKYVPDNTPFHVRPDQRLFDACYLVDGKRNGQPIAAEAKYGAFPVMAESIGAMIDEKAGTAYTQWIFNNLAHEYTKRPDLPMYSAVGAYSVQVPAYFVEKASTNAYAQKILLHLLSPANMPDEQGRWNVRGDGRHLGLAAPDKNLEDKGYAGRARSRRLLRESIHVGDDQARPTLFHARVADLIETSTDNNVHARTVEQLARAGTPDPKSGAASASWISYFLNLGDDPKLDATHNRINEFMRYRLIESFRRREGEKEDEARGRLREIPESMRKRFGGRTQSGEDVEEYFGECGDALDEVKKLQVSIFRQMVRLYLQDILVGHSEDPLIARGGKLGYTWDFFDGLVTDFDQFLKLLEEVRHLREKVKPELRLLGLSEKAKRFSDMTTGKKIFWLWEHPDVKGAEDAYLQAQQRNLDLRREDILQVWVTRTVSEMQDICREARDAVQQWILYLATGDDASKLPGLWDGINKNLQALNHAQAWDTNTPRVQKVIAEGILQVQEADIAVALKAWKWKVEFSGSDPKLRLSALIDSAVTDEMPEELQHPTMSGSYGQSEVASANQNKVLSLARREFVGHAQRTTVAEEIKRLYPRPEVFVAEVIGNKAEPLFDGVIKNPRKKSNLIRVQCNENDQYFVGEDGIQGGLRANANKPRNVRDDTYAIQVVGSEHPYKLTVVRTDDLYAYDTFSAWEECKRAYEAHFSEAGHRLDPTLMHIFPAEARAAAYERADYKKNNVYNEIHSRVVMLLEDTNALQQFFYLYAFGKIEENEPTLGGYRWELDLGEKDPIWLTAAWDSGRDAGKRPKPDILNAIHGYVILRSNQSPTQKRRIDTDVVQRWIDKELASFASTDEKRIKEEIKFIQTALSDDGLVGWLRAQADDPDDPSKRRKDILDLARVVDMLFAERLAVLEKLEKKAKGDGAFKRYAPTPERKSEK